MSTPEKIEVAAVVDEKMDDAMTPGFQAEFDPDEAELAGAFHEDALTAGEAAESSIELAEIDLAFVEVGDGSEVPPIPTVINMRETFGLREGESLTDALDRLEQGGED